MREQFHKALFLLKLLGICLIFLFSQRLLFFLSFLNEFQDDTFLNLFKAFLTGILTDGVVIVIYLLPTWLVLLFFNVENKIIKTVALVWFCVGFTFATLLNLVDIGYFPITKKRIGAELLDVLPEVPTLLGGYIASYWYLVALLIAYLFFAIWVFKKQLDNFKNKSQNFKLRTVNVLFIIVFFTIVARGGINKRPVTPFDIPAMVEPKLQWLASNTPFQFLHTLDNKGIKIENYFDEVEAEKIIDFEKQFKSKSFQKKNILFIILESFCTERVGMLNPTMKPYTPFMDSLLLNARTYKYGVANGKSTIDALPSVLSGIPSFMEKNYCYSIYNNNNVHAISYLLEKEGYHTAFFYGGLKTTFGFENFMNINFTKNYFDQEDYDSHYENSGWGVDDHLFLSYAAGKLKTLPQPFCASLLTLSLHHPFPVPEPYKTMLDTIKDPIKKSIKYTDLSLQLFFSKVKNEPWFKNSIVAICADHTSDGLGYLQPNPINAFSVPISFIAVGDTAFNKVQNQSISQIDMYPTILDYLGYNKPFVSLGKSALTSQNPSVIYGGNGIFRIFDYPYILEYNNNTQKVFGFIEYNENRTFTYLLLDDVNKPKIDRLTNYLKAHIQVFSHRINKNQF